MLSPQLKRANLGAEFDGIDGIVRKIASDEAEVDSAGQDSFIFILFLLRKHNIHQLGDHGRFN